MATYDFAVGTINDYYGGGFTHDGLSGFPIADYNDFNSVIYVSHAIGVALLDLVRWVWRTQSWDVTFSETSTMFNFLSTASDEFGILNVPPWKHLSGHFSPGVVINNSGSYGFQSDLFLDDLTDFPGISDGTFNLSSAGGTTLVFKSPTPPHHTATAVESAHWIW